MRRPPLTDGQIALLAAGSMPDAVAEDIESALTSMAQEIQDHRQKQNRRVDAIMGEIR